MLGIGLRAVSEETDNKQKNNLNDTSYLLFPIQTRTISDNIYK